MVPTRLAFLYTGRVMYLLYLDASGTVLDPNEKYIVVAGVAIFERQIYHAVKGLDELAGEINPHHPEEVEFHGSVMFQAREDWKRIGLGKSRDLITSALGVLKNTHKSTRLFAAAIHKSAISPRDPIEYAFEQVPEFFHLRDHAHGDHSVENMADGLRMSFFKLGEDGVADGVHLSLGAPGPF